MSHSLVYPSTRQDLVNTGHFFHFARQKAVNKASATRQRESLKAKARSAVRRSQLTGHLRFGGEVPSVLF